MPGAGPRRVVDEVVAATRRFEPLAFWVLAGLVAASYALLAWRQLGYGLEFDESYNLTVVENLAEGRGYASNGTQHLVATKPFDPYVSTGPTLLVPAAVVWRLTAGTVWAVRLVPLAFFALYLCCLGRLVRDGIGRWAGLLALAAPLAITVGIPDLTTTSLVPGRVVGEFAGTALVVAAAWALSRDRAFTGGLLAGLAVQTKLTFAVAGAVVLAAWLAGRWVAGRPWSWRGAVAAAIGAVLPTLAFELYRLSQLGFSGYGESVVETRRFLSGQTLDTVTPDLIYARTSPFLALVSPGGLVLTLLVLWLMVLVTLTRGRLRVGDAAVAGGGDEFPAAAMGLITAGLVLLAVWMTLSSQSLGRQGMPAVLLVLPVLAATVVPSLRTLWAGASARTRPLALGLAGLVWAVTLAVVMGQGARIAKDSFGAQLREEQERAAAAVVASGTPSLPVEDWWQLAELQILTDLPPSTTPGADAPTVQVFTSVRAKIEAGTPDARAFLERCGEVLLEEQSVVVCRQP